MTKPDELKPCPECKYTDELVRHSFDESESDYCCIRCGRCGFQGPFSYFGEEAEHLWNAVEREQKP